MLGKCNRPEFSLGRNLYHWNSTLPFFLCCGYKYMWKTGKSLGSLKICAALSAFPSPFCLAYSPTGSSQASQSAKGNFKCKQNGEGKEITNFLGFPVFHAKPQQRKWQRYNDLQWHNLRTRRNPGLSHLPKRTKFRWQELSIGQAVSEIFIIIIIFISGWSIERSAGVVYGPVYR